MFLAHRLGGVQSRFRSRLVELQLGKLSLKMNICTEVCTLFVDLEPQSRDVSLPAKQ